MEENTLSFSVFPNPTTDYVTIQIQAIKGTLRLMDLAGKTLYETKISNENTSISLAHYPTGVYVLTITSGKAHQVEKIVKY